MMMGFCENSKICKDYTCLQGIFRAVPSNKEMLAQECSRVACEGLGEKSLLSLAVSLSDSKLRTPRAPRAVSTASRSRWSSTSLHQE